MIKHRVLLIAIAVAILALFSSCYIDPYIEGNVYLAYYWDNDYPIRNYSDNNRWMPYIIANNTYYEVEPGEYSGYYTSYLGFTWGYEYTLTANYERLSSPYYPEPTYFQLWLSESGPFFYDNTSSRDLKKNSVGISTITKTPMTSLNLSNGSRTVIEKKVNGYTIHLEYWKVE